MAGEVSIEQGGTGQATAALALAALGGNDKLFFGNGADGAATMDNAGTGVTGTSDADVGGTRIYTALRDLHFTSLMFDTSGGAVKLNMAGFRLYVSGLTTMTVTSTIENSGVVAVGGGGGAGASTGTIGGGTAGGNNATAGTNATNVAGAIGGASNTQPAGTITLPLSIALVADVRALFQTIPVTGLAGTVILTGGSGGGGGADAGGTGGGGGGGAGVCIVATKTITGAGTIAADGKDGAAGVGGNAEGGGGGGGGFAALITTTSAPAATVQALGGSGGAGAGAGVAGSAGSAGGTATIII